MPPKKVAQGREGRWQGPDVAGMLDFRGWRSRPFLGGDLLMRRTRFLAAAGCRFAITAVLTVAAVGLAGTTIAAPSALPGTPASAGTSATAPEAAASARISATAASGIPADARKSATPVGSAPDGGAAAAPAMQAPSGPAAPSGSDPGTTVTFTVNTGFLTISVPATADLGSALPGEPTSGALGDVTVTDDRAELAPTWTATVISSDLANTSTTGAAAIPATDVSYWSGTASATTGTGTFAPGQATAGDAVPIDTTQTAFSLTAGVGNNSATWDATLILTVPWSAVPGTYSGTITHSVA